MRSRPQGLWPSWLILVGALLASGASAQNTFVSTLVAEHSGLCLEVPGASTAANVQLVQNTCHGRALQH